jgi:hypothetical protein
VNRIASAAINGTIVAAVPYTLNAAVKYVGVEGSGNANIDNFAVQTGDVATAPAVMAVPPATTTTFATTPITSDVLGTSAGSVLA